MFTPVFSIAFLQRYKKKLTFANFRTKNNKNFSQNLGYYGKKFANVIFFS